MSWPAEDAVIAAQRGDAASVAVLLTASYPHVRRFAHSLCASRQDAEDAAQEAMIVLFQRVGTLRAAGALASWLFRIVRNECLRRSRSLVHHTALPVDLPGHDVENEVLRRLEVERVAQIIAALPEDQRRVLVLRDVQGLPGEQVASVLGISTAAMKSRLHRARASVRESLVPAGEA